MKNRILNIPLIASLFGCVSMPSTVEHDSSLSFTEVNGYKFHTVDQGSEHNSVVIVVHGGPGGDHQYLKTLTPLSDSHHVIFYDQRGAGLSPRVDKAQLTIEQNLDDLDSIVDHFAHDKKVILIGHSWGGMLVTGYLSKHPEKVSHAVVVEPGMLYPDSAEVFIKKMKSSRSFFDALALVRHSFVYPFIQKTDGHEGFDYVMTKLLNRGEPGAPYQCENESMSADAFKRAGYDAFNNMLSPIMSNPELFAHDLTDGIDTYEGNIMLVSSECSYFGYEFQKNYHLPKLPTQTQHVQAKGMGHNMLTLNPDWSLKIIRGFLQE
ncbi:alpha/beta hydrolase [Vibrio kyushuensis]|uniref:alpha/beta fold hydrolase n=1 Tax=Vibrio kyushuensis TaxID=2910249 RepID=UPI003D1263EF